MEKSEVCNLDSNWKLSVVSQYGKDDSEWLGHQSEQAWKHAPIRAVDMKPWAHSPSSSKRALLSLWTDNTPKSHSRFHLLPPCSYGIKMMWMKPVKKSNTNWVLVHSFSFPSNSVKNQGELHISIDVCILGETRRSKMSKKSGPEHH